ncbi:MAG: cysteine desulfurase, partial [Bacteroidales bacterium]
IYLDNCATTQKPICVIECMKNYYTDLNSNVHRGVHYLSQEGTSAFESAREVVQQFIGAQQTHEIIFTKGTTESINLVAQSFGEKFVNPGDEILISTMEHHANIVPWQMLCQRKAAKLNIIPMSDQGELDETALDKLLTPKTKILALAHVSNVLGTINPIKRIIKLAHAKGIRVLIDGAQAVSHIPVNVQDLDCDFYCFSGHKMYAPMGVGVLYGKEALLNAMPPYQTGGEMIKNVSFETSTFNELPFKFEAGTPAVPEVLALKAAILFMQNIGIENMAIYENSLYTEAFEKLQDLGGIEFIGTAKEKAAVLSFNIKGVHPYDVGVILDQLGIAVRTGHHCAQPLMDRCHIPGTVRACFAIYNTSEEINIFIEGLKKAKEMLS